MLDLPARRVEWHSIPGAPVPVWHLHGTGMGSQGLYMQSVKGFYHPVRVPRVQNPAFFPGAIAGVPKTDPTVTDLKVLSVGVDDDLRWEDVENKWWSSWSDEVDGTLRVYNRRGTGYREQAYRLQSWPDDAMDFEPDEEWPWAMPLIAYKPGWLGQTITSSWSGSGDGVLEFVNPGDLDIWVQLSLSNTGVEQWTVPTGIDGDTVALEVFDAGVGNLFIDTDPFVLQLESHTESQIAMSLLGLRFRFPIPANTIEPVEVPISVSGGSGLAQAYMTPKWRRPW